MALEIKVGPPQLAIHQGHAVLLTGTDGQIRGQSEKGYYFFDTRVINHWTVYANGEPWDLLNGGTTAAFAAQIFLTNRAFITEAGPVEAHTVGLTISREIGGGLHEDLDLINYGRSKARFNLEMGIRSDFADLFEVKSGHFVRRGHISTAWSQSEQRLVTTYRNQDFLREVVVSARNHGSIAAYANGRMTFDIAMEPAPAGIAVCDTISQTGVISIMHRSPAPTLPVIVRKTASGLHSGIAQLSSSRAVMRRSGACFSRARMIWPHCACRSVGPRPKPRRRWCQPLAFRGSWPCSGATV